MLEPEQSVLAIAGGLNLHYFDYVEELTRPLKSTESGILAGFPAVVEIGFGKSEGVPFFKGKFEYSPSNTKYDGSLQNGTPIVGVTLNQFRTVEGVVGLPLFWGVTLFAGMGHRYWLRRIGYDEHYRWYSFIGGLKFGSTLRDPREKTTFGVELSARPTWRPELTVDYFEPPQYAPPKLGLRQRIGFKAEVQITYPLASSFDFQINPWAEYSALGGSDWVYYEDSRRRVYIREPSSRTYQFGISNMLVMKLF